MSKIIILILSHIYTKIGGLYHPAAFKFPYFTCCLSHTQMAGATQVQGASLWMSGWKHPDYIHDVLQSQSRQQVGRDLKVLTHWAREGSVPQQEVPMENTMAHSPTAPGNWSKRAGGQGMDSDDTDLTIQSCQDSRVSHEGNLLFCFASQAVAPLSWSDLPPYLLRGRENWKDEELTEEQERGNSNCSKKEKTLHKEMTSDKRNAKAARPQWKVGPYVGMF